MCRFSGRAAASGTLYKTFEFQIHLLAKASRRRFISLWGRGNFSNIVVPTSLLFNKVINLFLTFIYRDLTVGIKVSYI